MCVFLSILISRCLSNYERRIQFATISIEFRWNGARLRHVLWMANARNPLERRNLCKCQQMWRGPSGVGSRWNMHAQASVWVPLSKMLPQSACIHLNSFDLTQSSQAWRLPCSRAVRKCKCKCKCYSRKLSWFSIKLRWRRRTTMMMMMMMMGLRLLLMMTTRVDESNY